MSSETKRAGCQIAIAMVFLVGLAFIAENLAQGADADAAPGDAGVKAAKSEGPSNVLDLIMAGGYVMIPLGLCSVLALAIAVERFISLNRDKLIPQAFSEGLRASFTGGRKDYGAAMQYCEQPPVQ